MHKSKLFGIAVLPMGYVLILINGPSPEIMLAMASYSIYNSRMVLP